MRAPTFKMRWRPLAAVAAVAALLAAGWFALRDSGLVAVEDVEISGVSGPQRQAVRSALEAAGREMTTLHVRPGVLRAAVARYPVVEAVRAEADLPHRLRLRVVQREPVAQIVTPQGSVPVAADGTLLSGTTADGAPAIKLRFAPAGRRVTDRRTLKTVALLAQAPGALRAKAASAFQGPRGLTVHLADGPAVHFGSSRRLRAKWASLTAVLASEASRGATAIDVRVPEHPAAAGLEQAPPPQEQPSTGA
jgi:cell division septal protein FtsQ